MWPSPRARKRTREGGIVWRGGERTG
uniref:Uncharacterized protein n=1 Tax=Arundo donax TaxID=35708 RepID=A0A0A9FFJ1_ARUDO